MKKFAFAALLLAAAPMSAALAADTTYATLHAGEPAVAADSGRIYLYRESSMMGAVVQPDVYVDGQKVWVAKNGDYYYVDRPAGSHEVSTSTDDKDDAVTVPLAAGQSVYVRIHIEMGFFAGHGQPSIMLPEKAADGIKDCDYAAKDAVAPPPAATPAPAPKSSVARSL
ncbi:MAG TPA: DUF2846 domain-containing protein [Rhizomicrobium sp.]|jgi:hypothetical protein